MQILMVDRDQNSLDSHQTFISALGHKVHCSPNLGLALKKMQSSHFDISFVDENVINGHSKTFLNELKSINALLPLIITTNNMNISKLMKLLSFRPFDIIKKPLDLHTLLFMQLLVTDRAP
jgi:DNA-binding NtrC family response regulator